MEKKIMMIEESLYEFAKRGRPRKRGRKPSKKIGNIDAPDSWDNAEDEEDIKELEDIDTTDMSNVEEIEIEKDAFDDKLMKLLTTEVKLPEISRGVLTFRLKGNLEKILSGVPMIKLKDQDAFVFKMQGGSLKKIFLRDIIPILESNESKNNRALTINE